LATIFFSYRADEYKPLLQAGLEAVDQLHPDEGHWSEQMEEIERILK
jgi:hypothetical protein